MSSALRSRAIVAIVSTLLLFGAAPSAAAAAPLEPASLPPIVNITPAILDGELTVGSSLTVNPGTWSPADVSFTYEWGIGDGCCSGGPLDTTGPVHVITAQDSYSGFIGVTVRVTKAGYAPTSVTLGAGGRIIADVPPAPVASPAGLTTANRGALAVTTTDTTATISIPGTGPGIRFYVYGYSLPTPLGFFDTIDPELSQFQPAYDIEVDYSALGDGPQRLAVLTVSGTLVGWVWVDDEPLAPPVPDSSGLTEENQGGAEVAPTNTANEVVIDVPGAQPGDSVQIDAFSTPTRLGWYTVDGNRQVRVNFSTLPVGDHHITITAADGTLLGWVPVTAVEVSLANTGPALAPALPLAAGVLLGLAGLLMFLARRRARLG